MLLSQILKHAKYSSEADVFVTNHCAIMELTDLT